MMFLCLLFVQWIHAAPHKDFPESVSTNSVKQLLQTPDQVSQLKDLGPQGYKVLREIMLSNEESMKSRWNATLAIARIGGKNSQPDIDLALKHQVWFLRSAGLLANAMVEADHGVAKAKQFLRRDPALLVRATALQVVAQEKTIDRNFLWSELYNPLNFNKGQSLSLRVSLLKVLSQNASKAESAKFVALTRDQHPEIQKLAKNVLDGQIFNSKNATAVK